MVGLVGSESLLEAVRPDGHGRLHPTQMGAAATAHPGRGEERQVSASAVEAVEMIETEPRLDGRT